MTKTGANKRTKDVTIRRIADKIPNVLSIRSLISESSLSWYSAITGINAWLKAPSANNLLKTLGIFIITTKVSSATPAPNKPVITTSRANPKILEIKVQKETNPLLANSFKDFFWR